jgi:arsenite methyltransferase
MEEIMDKKDKVLDQEEIRQAVRAGYAEVAKQNNSCCGPSKSKTNNKTSGCGCSSPAISAENIARQVGYSDSEMAEVPDGANLGLGCGNPIALASLKPGEVVLDLGSGAGFDAFLASPRVGENGRVIGVDMTPEMLDKARANKAKGNYKNVEFRLGEIENLPVADNSVDVIISNCVINLSVDKARVFAEAFRVLKPNGRLMVSDIVILKELPEILKESIVAYIGCVSGASAKNEYLKLINRDGFKEVKVVQESSYPIEGLEEDAVAGNLREKAGLTIEQLKGLAASIVSVKVSATKSNQVR